VACPGPRADRCPRGPTANHVRRFAGNLLRDKAANTEKRGTSTFGSPTALMKATALAPMPSIVVGTSPELLEMPAVVEEDHFSVPWRDHLSPPGPNGPSCR